MRIVERRNRIPRLCVRWARRLAAAALLFALPGAVLPQDLQDDNPAEARGLPSGFRLNSVSAWTGRNYLVVPGAASSNYMLGYGGGIEARWNLSGRTTQASVTYVGAYDGNSTYPELSGFDHTVLLSWSRRIAPGLSLSVTGTGESTTFSGFLLRPVTSATPDLSSVSALGGYLVPTGAAGATQTILYPGRRKTALVNATLGSSAQKRVTWYVTMHGQRLLPTQTYAGGGGSGYSGETDEGATLSLAYSLSRRTSVGAETGYFRTASPNGTTQAGSAGFSMTRVLSRRWYGSAVLGYGLGDFVLPSTKATYLRTDFQGRATLGTTFDTQSLALSVVRQIGDSYGLGAQRTSLANLIWTWHPKRQRWGLQGMAGFEQLSGLQVGKIEAAVFQAAVTRRLTDQFSCAAEGAYTWGLEQAAFGLPRRDQNTMRLSIVWRPAGGLW